jgi:hypothetical protein
MSSTCTTNINSSTSHEIPLKGSANGRTDCERLKSDLRPGTEKIGLESCFVKALMQDKLHVVCLLLDFDKKLTLYVGEIIPLQY